MHHGYVGSTLQVELAADVAGGNERRLIAGECPEFSIAQALAGRWLEYGVGAGGTAAEVRLGSLRQFEARPEQDVPDQVGQPAPVLQAAWGMSGRSL